MTSFGPSKVVPVRVRVPGRQGVLAMTVVGAKMCDVLGQSQIRSNTEVECMSCSGS